MNNSRKDTVIISNSLAEEIRWRTNLSRQGEGKAKQVICLAFLTGLHVLCLCFSMSAATLLWTRKTPVRRSSDAKVAARELEMGTSEELEVLLGARAVGQLLWCSSMWARSLSEQFGISLLQPGWQWGAWSLTFTSGLCQPHVRVPREWRRSCCVVVSSLRHAKIKQFRDTAGNDQERRERAATLFKDITTFITNQTNCPTVVTPRLGQWLAPRIDVKHLKWEITNTSTGEVSL